MSSRPLIALITLVLLALPGLLKAGIDFSHYDEPVYDQIVDRIKARIAPRLSAAPLTKDRYFIIPFAYEDRGNHPEHSHSFISVIRVFASNKPVQVTPELKTRTYKNWEFEAFTISWLPADFMENPNLCVFKGFGARLFPKNNKCPVSPGKSFDLQQTIALGANTKNCIVLWGPYEIVQQAFELGVKRMRLLNSGEIKYRADDRLYRKTKTAISCFHAMAGLDELYPSGGLFNTGFKMWGINGTRRVLIEYTKKASNKGMLLDHVDIKNDLYGFVYAPRRSEEGVYDPIEKASAYH